MKIDFKPFEKKVIPVAGQFIYIAECPDTVTVTLETVKGFREYQLERMDMIRLGDEVEFNQFELTNNSESAGTIILKAGYGTLTPSRNKQEVSLTSSIDLTVERISFNGKQPVYQAEDEVFKTEYVGTQKVEVMNPVQLPEVHKVLVTNEQKAPEVFPLDPITLDAAGQATIVSNPLRKGVIIQADEANSSHVLVCGLKLNAGGVLSLPASNTVQVTGTTGDKLYLAEEVLRCT